MSLFPPPDKNGQIKFVLATKLPYAPRMALTAALLAAALCVQLTLSFWAGLAVLLAASLFGMVKGYDARLKTSGGEKWERVTPDEYAVIRLKAAQLRKWDEDLFDITNPKGAAAFAAACALCAGLYFALAARFSLPYSYWLFAGADALVILLPLWCSGVRQYLRKDRLIVKIELLESMMKLLAAPSEVQVFPMLALTQTEGGAREPQDARVMVKLVGAPAAFYEMQVQISINSVQGKDFPYLYCVLVAKAGAGLLAGYERFTVAPPVAGPASILAFLAGRLGLSSPGLVYEAQKSPDADILIVRQQAGKNSGYATPAPAAGAIVTAALELAKKLLSANAAAAPR